MKKAMAAALAVCMIFSITFSAGAADLTESGDGFYTKCVTVYSIPIYATDDVPDEALYKARDVLEMLFGKCEREYPEIMNSMRKNGVSVIIIGEHETNAMHPSWSGWEDKTERRGGGGITTTVLVEDLLVPEEDEWRKSFAGLVHEACHTLLTYGIGDGQGIGARSDFYERINAAYKSAEERGMYPEPNEYDMTNYHEYFTGEVCRFFNGNPTNLPVENAYSMTDREQLEIYDKEMYDILDELFDKCDLPYPWGSGTGREATDENVIKTDDLAMQIGQYGQILSLKITSENSDDFKRTEYVLNAKNAPNQANSDEHEWMGELILSFERGGKETEFKTSESGERLVEFRGGKVSVLCRKDGVALRESYYAAGKSIRWDIEVENEKEGDVTVKDLGLPMPFNQYWTPAYSGEELYDTRCVYHSFVGKNSSYIYALRPSGQGKMLVFTPVAETGAGFEYRDHWREDNGHKGSVWAQDSAGYSSGLDVFYIHSDKIKSTGSGYMNSTSLKLAEGETKTYSFEFTAAENETEMKSVLYEKGVVDAQAVPSMAVSLDMPASFYLHANDDIEIKSVDVKCVHETKLYSNLENCVNNNAAHLGQGEAAFRERKIYNGENYYVYDLDLKCLGANHVFVGYTYKGEEYETMLQFYAMESLGDAISRRSAFLTKHQTDLPGEVGDKTFDDWMMDGKKNRAETTNGYWDMSYWGWGDDWGLTHGLFLAQKNVYKPVREEVEALDDYLDTAIWNTLMREHQEDFLVHDFLSSEPNMSPTYRGYAYPHIYNTYFAMYRICSLYPDLTNYKEERAEYLMRAYSILKALYSDKVAYNWATGLMGEMTTPDIIEALEREGFSEEAGEVRRIMGEKYDNFKNTKYPYGSEYSYDNTGEEAVYTLAKMNGNTEMMRKINLKTRSCRGLQPVWYLYADPVTICGENWWNFQYSASLAGYCMDDWLMSETEMADDERAIAARCNYGGKLANFTCINSGQIDSDGENIGTVSWTYQSELGNSGGQGMGGGKLHNGWRQMSGEADLGLFGAMEIISSDVSRDPIFGVVGYGCKAEDTGKSYRIIPSDGIFARLNLINERLCLQLEGAEYSEAEIKKDKSEIKLRMKSAADFVTVRVSGLEEGERYALCENGRIKATSYGKDALFIYKSEGEAVTVIKKAPHALDIEPYSPQKAERRREERQLLSEGEVRYEFKNSAEDAGENGADGKAVGNVIFEDGWAVCDGTVTSYVRLPSSLACETEDFTLRLDLSLDGKQKASTPILEFSDMRGKNLAVIFGEDNEAVLEICGEKISSGVCLPENYEGEIILRQKGEEISLFCGGELLLRTKTDFTLSSLGEVERNYLGRGSDESRGALRGRYGNFRFVRLAEEVAEKASGASVVEAEKIVTDGFFLPEYVTALWSDGFKRRTKVTWGSERDGYIEGDAMGLAVSAKVRHVNLGENKALTAVPDASYCAPWESVEAINDGIYTLETSNPEPSDVKRFGTWTRDSSEEWISLSWESETQICGAGLVFCDDGGGTRAPVSYEIEYLTEDGQWEKVSLPLGGGNELCKINVTTFEAVQTKAVRIVMQKGSFAAVGVLEAEFY